MKTIIPDDIQDQAHEYYSAVRQLVEEDVSVTVLHIDNAYSFIAQGVKADKPDNLWVFDIGTVKTAQDFFKHVPPTPAEVEYAIMEVEDEVMPLHKLLVPDSSLYTFDSAVREAAVLGVVTETAEGIILARSEMEYVFNRLAAIISGRPASQDVLPADNSFAASLLILREVMHHLAFKEITILAHRG
jgi:exopolyphosphatase/pppGpp-phosphohydrolase